jgi:DNA-binding transcriptional MerR regulator
MSLVNPEKDLNTPLEPGMMPEKRYFTISEVAKLCDIKPHVLRYWEQEFPKLKPNKRRGNRRYYIKDDVLLILRIKSLLYEQGFTLAGARKQLKQEPVPTPTLVSPAPASTPAPVAAAPTVSHQILRSKLEDVLELLTV